MVRAQVITIGTEITSGEVVNSNAAWVSQRLEEVGVRVLSHISVRDHGEEIRSAFAAIRDCEIVVVTGGLGPTSDDITRNSMAEYSGQALEFDAGVFTELEKLYKDRELSIREAHKHQCFFPKDAERLPNPVGTALGFTQEIQGRSFFVLPGPPRELEGIWNSQVVPRLIGILPRTSLRWTRWTCLGLPESEVAEIVEKVVAGSGLEVGYRAAVPYVKVKVYADTKKAEHRQKMSELDQVLDPYVVGRGLADLADELLERWPLENLEVWDMVSDGHLSQRLFSAAQDRRAQKKKTPTLSFHVLQKPIAESEAADGILVRSQGEEFSVSLRAPGRNLLERKTLPYKLSLSSERGKRSVAEWVLWNCVRALRAD